MSVGIVVGWLGGNCPVQAEGTFDGEAFYFRARGTQVTCEVGEWEWRGPEYEWPDAGYISEAVARAFIGEAYGAWRRRNDATSVNRAEYRARNADMEESMYLMQAAGLVKHISEAAADHLSALGMEAFHRHREPDAATPALALDPGSQIAVEPSVATEKSTVNPGSNDAHDPSVTPKDA